MDVKLGFGSIPKPQYVFVSKQNDHCWYMLAEDEKRIPIYDRALTGIITGIEVNKIVETTFSPVARTDLHILADQPYIVRSGSDTFFSKGLLLSLDAITTEQLSLPLTITVSPGDRGTVFCNVYNPITYRSIDVNWDGHQEIDWQALGQKISLKINNIQNSHKELNSSENRAGFIAQTDTYLSQLNWSPEQGREFLQQKYGKRSRYHLSETEMLDFIDYLKIQLTHSYQT